MYLISGKSKEGVGVEICIIRFSLGVVEYKKGDLENDSHPIKLMVLRFWDEERTWAENFM